jgi:hypothetical protein
MAIIGIFKATENGYEGKLETRTLGRWARIQDRHHAARGSRLRGPIRGRPSCGWRRRSIASRHATVPRLRRRFAPASSRHRTRFPRQKSVLIHGLAGRAGANQFFRTTGLRLPNRSFWRSRFWRGFLGSRLQGCCPVAKSLFDGKLAPECRHLVSDWTLTRGTLLQLQRP